MGIRSYKPYTDGTRQLSISDFADITKSTPEKSLTKRSHRQKGRNNRGVITSRHRGGGHKRLYRIIDFHRNKLNVPAQGGFGGNMTPTAMPALLCFFTKMGKSATFCTPQSSGGMTTVHCGSRCPIRGGQCPARSIRFRWVQLVHNVELHPG
jgi:large subunit ribosomal protein L2